MCKFCNPRNYIKRYGNLKLDLTNIDLDLSTKDKIIRGHFIKREVHSFRLKKPRVMWLPYIFWGQFEIIYKDNKHYLHFGGDSESEFELPYCFMCGKKLKKED